MRFEVKPLGLVMGPVLALVISLLPTPAAMTQYAPEGFGDAPKLILAMMVWTFTWWITEPMPLGITALLPGTFTAILYGANPKAFGYVNTAAGVRAVFSTYMDPTIVLFFAGFILASAMATVGLDKRIAYGLAGWKFAGKSPTRMTFAIWTSCWFLSWWISNTVATMMLYPIVVSVLTALDLKRGSKTAEFMMLGLGFAASSGGLATILGTPPNLLAASTLESAKVAKIPFVGWMVFGIPIACLTLITQYIVLKAMIKPGFEDAKIAMVREKILEFKRALGPMKKEERIVLCGFTAAVIIWITREMPPLIAQFNSDLAKSLSFLPMLFPHDSIPPLVVSLALFAVPTSLRPYKPLLDWKSGTKYVEWEVLLIFGGGLVLGDALLKSGMAKWMAMGLLGGQVSVTLLAVIGIVLAFVITQFTSNTSTAAMLAPLLVGVGRELGINAAGIAFAVICSGIVTSFALMFPISTPPNLIVYGSKYIRLRTMATVGIVLGIVWMALLIPIAWYLVPLVTVPAK